MKKELPLFVFLSVFITLIDLGTQIRGTQTRYTVVSFGLNQPLFTATNSLMDEIKTEYVHADFSNNKEMFHFSNYSTSQNILLMPKN